MHTVHGGAPGGLGDSFNATWVWHGSYISPLRLHINKPLPTPWWTDEVKLKGPWVPFWRKPSEPIFHNPPGFFCQVTSPNPTKNSFPTNPPSRPPRGHRSLRVDGAPSRRCIGQRPSREPGQWGGGWLEVKYVDGWWMMWMIWMILYIQKIKSEIWALLKKQVVYLYVKWWARKGASEAWKARWSYHINDLSLKALAAFTGGPFDGGEPPFDRKTQTKETQHHPKSRFQEEDSNRPFRT